MPDSLRWSWWKDNKVHNKCNVLKTIPKPPPPQSVGKSSSTKLAPSARNVGDRPRASILWLPGEPEDTEHEHHNPQEQLGHSLHLSPGCFLCPIPMLFSGRLFPGRERRLWMLSCEELRVQVPAKCRVKAAFGTKPLLFAGITGELIRNTDSGLPGPAKPLPASVERPRHCPLACELCR